MAEEEPQSGDPDNKIMPSVGFHRINLEKKSLKDELIYYIGVYKEILGGVG